jgi:hypothetical protein
MIASNPAAALVAATYPAHRERDEPMSGNEADRQRTAARKPPRLPS